MAPIAQFNRFPTGFPSWKIFEVFQIFIAGIEKRVALLRKKFNFSLTDLVYLHKRSVVYYYEDFFQPKSQIKALIYWQFGIFQFKHLHNSSLEVFKIKQLTNFSRKRNTRNLFFFYQSKSLFVTKQRLVICNNSPLSKNVWCYWPVFSDKNYDQR